MNRTADRQTHFSVLHLVLTFSTALSYGDDDVWFGVSTLGLVQGRRVRPRAATSVRTSRKSSARKYERLLTTVAASLSRTRGNGFSLSPVACCRQVPNGRKTAARARAERERPGPEGGRRRCPLACVFHQKTEVLETLPPAGQGDLLSRPPAVPATVSKSCSPALDRSKILVMNQTKVKSSVTNRQENISNELNIPGTWLIFRVLLHVSAGPRKPLRQRPCPPGAGGGPRAPSTREVTRRLT